jgi:pimeloyl-[acyl-carrier protein] synthase
VATAFTPALPAWIEDPYPFYAQLRADDPVHWAAEPQGRWVLTRYADVTAALRDPRLVKAGAKPLLNDVPAAVLPELAPLQHTVEQQIDSINPPLHTRLRRLVNAGFTPELVAARRDQVQQAVDALLDGLVPRGQMDLIRDFTGPLPATIILEVFGVPPAAREHVKAWSDDYAALMGHGPLDADPAGVARRAQASIQAFTEFLRGVVADHRQHPRGDLLDALIAAEDQDDALTADELLANLRVLLIAGNETTTNLIGNGMLALLRQPDQLARLRADPSLVPTAVEELLRYDSPAQMVFRWAGEDFSLGGKAIQQGQMVVMVTGAANRDPAQFPEPDRLDVARHPNEHHAFGFGIHYCVGAPLARLEAQLAFPALLRRLANLELAGAPVRQPNPVLRGLQSLPLKFASAG